MLDPNDDCALPADDATATVAPGAVVTLQYRLRDAQGELLAQSASPEAFVLGSGSLLEAIESALMGQTVGTEVELRVEPEQAFGDYRADWVVLRARSDLPPDVDEGMQFEGLPGPAGADDPADAADRLFTVTDLTDEVAVLDGNHPLAGMALQFWLRIESVRRPSAQEAASGQVQGLSAAMVVSAGRDRSTSLH